LACQQLDEAAQQLEFLSEIKSTIGNPAVRLLSKNFGLASSLTVLFYSKEISFLSAQLLEKQGGDAEVVLTKLDDAVAQHWVAVEGKMLGEAYFLTFNPDFVLSLAKMFAAFFFRWWHNAN
jgi:hypothetical protein